MATGVAKTTTYSDLVLGVLSGTALTPPTGGTAYLALFTGSPGEAGAMASEPNTGGYVRQVVTFNPAADNAPNGRKLTNAADVTFPVATGDWGTISNVGVCWGTASQGGTVLYYGTLVANKVINSGDQFKMLAGSLTIGED